MRVAIHWDADTFVSHAKHLSRRCSGSHAARRFLRRLSGIHILMSRPPLDRANTIKRSPPLPGLVNITQQRAPRRMALLRSEMLAFTPHSMSHGWILYRFVLSFHLVKKLHTALGHRCPRRFPAHNSGIMASINSGSSAELKAAIHALRRWIPRIATASSAMKAHSSMPSNATSRITPIIMEAT